MAKLMKEGKELKVGAIVTDFRGEEMVVAGFSAPKTAASTGRIDLNSRDGAYLGQFYPSVVNAYIRLTKKEEKAIGRHFVGTWQR